MGGELLELEYFMPLILDLVTLVVLYIFVRIGSKHGFARTAIRFVGFFAAVALASLISSAAVDYLYDGMLRRQLIDVIDQSVREMSDPSLITAQISSAIDGMPTLFTNVLRFDAGDLSARLSTVVGESAETVAMTVVDGFVGPVVTALIKGFAFFVTFIVALFIVQLLSRVFGLVNDIPVLGPVNTFLGGIIGGLNGVLCLCVFMAAVSLLNAATNNGLPWLTVDNISATYLLKLFVDYNPLLHLLGY